MSSSLYLLVNLCVISIPFAFSWHPKIRFVDQWYRFWPACLITLTVFIIWDIVFTEKGIWGFNESYLLGHFLWDLPIEEWMFFVSIPYACVFSYFAFRSHRNSQSGKGSIAALWVILIVSVSLCALNWDSAYTASATGFAALLTIELLRSKPSWLSDFLVLSVFLVIPFILTNGVLTGLDFWRADVINFSPETIRDQIVWYSNAENLGVRILTIPIEDFFYGFGLIGMNIYLFERLKK